MPQVVLKNVSREKAVQLAPSIAKTVSEIINVPIEHIVVEHSETEFFRGGAKDAGSRMVWIYWRKRTPEMQKKVADALGVILKDAGYLPVEIVYSNLDMNDFYEYKE